MKVRMDESMTSRMMRSEDEGLVGGTIRDADERCRVRRTKGSRGGDGSCEKGGM